MVNCRSCHSQRTERSTPPLIIVKEIKQLPLQNPLHPLYMAKFSTLPPTPFRSLSLSPLWCYTWIKFRKETAALLLSMELAPTSTFHSEKHRDNIYLPFPFLCLSSLYVRKVESSSILAEQRMGIEPYPSNAKSSVLLTLVFIFFPFKFSNSCFLPVKLFFVQGPLNS